MGWYYRYETKGIQSWILDSNKLRDLAGGSSLIEELTQTARRRAEGATVIQATSGGMTAVFSSKDQMQAFASTWPMEVALRAPGLDLVQAWVPEEQKLPALFARLAERRCDRPVASFETNSWVVRTARSGLPGVPPPKKGFGSPSRATVLDEVAIAKERARNSMLSADGSTLSVTGGLPWSHFDNDLDNWGEGTVAVVHADGSAVGKKLIENSDSPENLRAFSTSLLEATKAANRVAMESLKPNRGTIEARPIVSAGDDLTVVLPAAVARRFTERWLKAFHDETKKHLGEALYGGAGVVYVHAHFPFAQAYQIAENVCKDVKDAVKSLVGESGALTCNVIGFRRITTSLTESAGTAYAWLLDPDSEESPIDALLAAVRNLPRGGLRGWLTKVEAGKPELAQLHWNRIEEVASSRQGGGWKQLTKALRDAGIDPANGLLETGAAGTVLATQRASDRSTPMRDLLALRFLEGKEQE